MEFFGKYVQALHAIEVRVQLAVVVVLLDIPFKFAGDHDGESYHVLQLAVAIVTLHVVAVFLIIHVSDVLLIDATHAHFLNVHVIFFSVIA